MKIFGIIEIIHYFCSIMLKICFIVDSLFSVGGVQRVTAVIAKQLSKEDDVTIVSFDNPRTVDKSLYDLDTTNLHFLFCTFPQSNIILNLFRKSYSFLYKKFQPTSKIASDLYALSSFPIEFRYSLTRILKQENFDAIIGVHAPLAARLATLRKSISQNTKLIGWIHNSFEALFCDSSLYIGPDRKRHYVYQFRKLDDVVLLCQHDAETYYHYDPLFRPTVIYNPLTLKPGSPAEGNSKRFLAVGRFARKHKGFDLLIEAFHLFAMKNNEWMLDIVGEGIEEKLYRELIKEYHLENRVFIHPFTNQIQDYYSQAQVYVLSSRWEGFGLVLVEAMAHGLPVISSDLPTSKEIMGDFGLYFKNGDINDLAEKLEVATQLDWERKSQEAIKISQRFNVNHIVEQWKKLIEKDE